jgi:hypothetical protein
MEIRFDGRTIAVVGREDEVHSILPSIRLTAGQELSVQIHQDSAAHQSAIHDEPRRSSPIRRMTDPPELSRRIRTDPNISKAIERYVLANPEGRPSDFVQSYFGNVPGFGAKGQFTTAYNNVYSRMTRIREKMGLGPTLTHRASPRESPSAGKSPSESRRVPTQTSLQPPGPDDGVVHLPTQQAVQEALIAAVTDGRPISTQSIVRTVARESDWENAQVKKRVSAYLARLRPNLALKAGESWERRISRAKGKGDEWVVVRGKIA